jgi:hypothetical protein
MNELLVEQRQGYNLALDRLIRVAEPKDRRVRCEASLKLEEGTEVEYRNTMILRRIYDGGLGEFRQQILDEGNSELEKFDWKFDSLGHYDKQRAFRSREDTILADFMGVIENYSGRGGEPSKDRNVEIRYLKNMVDRQIHSRGLPGDVMIPVALNKALSNGGLDTSDNYDRVFSFSLNFVNGYGNKLQGAKPNIYLINHDEHPISSNRHFPSGSLEILRGWGIIGDGPLRHYFLHFSIGNDSTIQIPRDENVNNNQVISQELGGFPGLISRYTNGEFNRPRFAITGISHVDELKHEFTNNGYNILEFQ